MQSPKFIRTHLFLLVLALALLSGCASTRNPQDPFEPVNRAVYQFNDKVDQIIMKPVATAYRSVLPQFVRTGVTNFYSNLSDILTALNNLLQGKLGQAASDVGRVAVNTTVGIVGLVDVGTKIGLEKHREDFGQTLGWWGLDSGPYLQLPFFGPSSVRDGAGQMLDFYLDPIRWIWRDRIWVRNSLWGLYYINTRANLLDTTKLLDEAALDPYEFQRDAYLQRRRSLVFDGNPPAAKDDEPAATKPSPRSEADALPTPSAGSLPAPLVSRPAAADSASRPAR